MPDKIMKTLTIGNTKYTIQDTRVDSLENELDDKLDAPASAGSNGQVLTLNSSGNPVWQNPPTELPSVSSSDNGKMLTVTNGAWAKGSVPTELPSVTTSDNGKILKVTSGTWAKGDVPTELPSVTTSDNNKILKVTNGAWAKGDAPTELPSVTSSDNDKILKVTNGAWAKGDAPGGLPVVSSSDNGKALVVSSGVWTKGKVGYNQLDSYLYADLEECKNTTSNNKERIDTIEETVFKTPTVTFIKGDFNVTDGTIDTTGNSVVSNIIENPYSMIAENRSIRLAYYDGNTYLGKLTYEYTIDKDSLSSWADYCFFGNDLKGQLDGISEEFNIHITGIRIFLDNPYDYDGVEISNDADAQAYGEANCEKILCFSKFDDKLDKPATAGTTGQVLSLNSNGDTVWTNASGGLPSVTSSDNGKILKVTNGAWAKGDGLPSVTQSDVSKVLVSNGSDWVKAKVSYLNLSTDLKDRLDETDRFEEYAILKEVKTTYTKGIFNTDGTINTSGNGVITGIIQSPWHISISTPDGNMETIHILAYNGNTCLGKISAADTIDKDSSSGWYELYGDISFNEDYFYFSENVTGVRLCFSDPYGNTSEFNITNDDDAESWAENCITDFTRLRCTTYEYVDTLKERIDNIYNIYNPATLQQICAGGLAPKYFDIGDIIYIDWTDRTLETPVTYQYPFVVAHFGTVYDENDVAHNNAMYLMAMYATPYYYNMNVEFDAPEAIAVSAGGTFDTSQYDYYTYSASSRYNKASVTNGATIPSSPIYYKYYKSTDSRCPLNPQNIMQRGWNRWAYSAIRQWLNSDAPKGTSWWTAQHEFDVAPVNDAATELPGWLDGFSQEWKNVFKPIRIKTWGAESADTTYDKFFIPSLEQVYGSTSTPDEGEYWEYWKNITGLNSPSNGSYNNTNAGRVIHIINNLNMTSCTVCLRSNSRGSNVTSTYGIYNPDLSGGYIRSDCYCSGKYPALPTFVLY